MPKSKLRVLLDLSMAASGYCGIAQDTRLLYKALASSPDVDVTGLIYLPQRLRPLHRFLPTSAQRGERLANQACFFWEFGRDEATWPPSKSWRALESARRLASTVLGARIQLDPLDVEMLGDVVWRLLFGPTLSADDMPLVRNGKFLLSNLSAGMVQSRVLLGRRPLRLDTRGFDFLIVQNARPFRTSAETRQIVRYHDMVPLIAPDTMTNPLGVAGHHKCIKQCREGSFFVCDSGPTRDALTMVYPELTAESATIPCMISEVYRPDLNTNLRSIMGVRRSAATGARSAQGLAEIRKYILCVSTLEPRKNFVGLMQAFNMLKGRSAANSALADLKLVIVGSPGWKFEPILSGMRELVEQGEVVHLEKVPPEELRVLYAHAAAFVFPSYIEGFGMPPVEAMQCGTPVIASDISVHRWVLGDAALYCNPYDVTSIAESVERLVASNESAALREKLVARGRERAKRFHVERCSRDWLELLHRLQEGRAPLEASLVLDLPDDSSRKKVA
jgi:hypothetical protein